MQYDISLTANGAQMLDVHGKFFKYKSGLGAIRIKTSKGGFVDLLPGQGVWGVDFDSLVVSDMSGATNKGVILAGAYDFHDDRITGTVDVVDGGKARSLAETAKIGYVYLAGVASTYAQVQMFNPAASAKNIYVEQVSVFSGGTLASGITLRSGSVAALPTFALNPVSKKLGGVASVGAINTQNNAAAAGTTNIVSLDKTTKIFKFTEPVLLVPGQGLVVVNWQVGEDLGSAFEIFEEPA